VSAPATVLKPTSTLPTSTLVDQQAMSAARNYFDWQGRLVAPELGATVVEAGCGIGNFTRMLLDRRLVVAVDVEAECVERLRQRYPNQANLRTEICGVESPEFAALRRYEADSCVCLNVLEHVEDDRGALRAMASILKPGGTIALLVPAFPALYGPTDENLGHYRRYTRSSMLELVRQAGLRVRKLHYVNSAGFFGWWANARVLRSQTISRRQVEIYDRYVAPGLSRIERIVKPPFGQSLFASLSTENLSLPSLHP
jgi:SAM-dependent methyltransferase